MLRARLQSIFRWLGRVGITFLVFLASDVALAWARPTNARIVVRAGVLITGIWLLVRLLRRTWRKTVWRLRNRLLVTYLFIAIVPIVLIATLVTLSALLLAQQLMVYLVAGELDRRVAGLSVAARRLEHTDPRGRETEIERMVELFYRARYPDIEVLLRQSGKLFRYPAESALPLPAEGWTPNSGILMSGGRFYLWCYTKTENGDLTIAAPLTGEFLAGLVPGLGAVDFAATRPGPGGFSGVPASERLPRPVNRFDREVTWYATVPTWDWEHPGKSGQGYLNVRSRVSAVVGTVFNRRTDAFQDLLVNLLIINGIVFILVEIIVVITGITMTRTITGAVHRLYEGTQKIMAGDFSHRIEVKGKDQLADLSLSFNQMSANVERLLEVAREKERLQSEIEIAREVQNQLYPRQVPASRTMRLTAVCQPARMVSGDYYDYESLRDAQIALAIGDVAGKGISAALLMATLQSSLRTQLQGWREMAAAGNGAIPRVVSTSSVVSHLNSQLYSYTSLEKFATFCLGVYDEPSGSFTYTNAGHLPPLLVREGSSQRLEVNGTVVGAFPFSPYDESRIDLKSGDLLVFFSDGVTEPENEYGEMFGEDRLTDLIVRNAHLSEDKIVELVLSSVHQWTASEELQDDMTILLAKRL